MRHFARSPSDDDASEPRRRALRRLLAAGAGACSPLAWAIQSPGVAGHGAGLAPRGTPAQTGESLLRASGLPLSSFGAYVRSVDSEMPLVAVNPESSYAMASTTKVVTSLAALDLLGVNFRWRTFAFLRGTLVEGTLLGDLLIVGGGDARLTSAELRDWFGQLRAQGLRRIAGNIVLDRYAFDLNEGDFANTPPPSTGRAYHVRPDAFAIDEGLLHVGIDPARGAKAAVALEPPLAGLRIVNKVAMRGGCSATARLADDASGQRLDVQGSWGANCGHRELTLVPTAPAQFTTRALAGLWAEAGGSLSGIVVERARQVGATLIPAGPDGQPQLPWSVHLSQPLPVVLHDMNKVSDNVTARHLMLALSRGFPLRAATLPDAQARMQEWLVRQGLGEGDVRVENGSGLSRGERAKPRALAHLLANAWHAPQLREFLLSLPVAGMDGTLQHRMQGTAAAGHAFLKTGTLLDTRALAGYVQAASGRIYAVAMMVNHPDAARATPALDRVIEWIAKSC
ncbi:D-alanyl-D-alanine carboxypeptidase/D-alanyl-D-alanine-endopeptidase [Scleromatobacter humisilvae]|uniref:D-alanyl-D-alanine carboxypeptidase/D-alanyl-D-alanine-endopeptidase n=1 Tax=Scleromatobacter humisilvae TaxID=2897159 RepID=A0A9X2C0Q4_9BURK|nr:D-alanyl-D-alanine carboxypeptidase/D-alanyl-D-alanine-endopeptidase [Scleromatobacter humisilvae]MCK9686656.1 D-alanyl-D-alanine carboxypeptidase/D-alanyl-D-alanine-endopeptidase [Scleromatobacter humisilvae]